MSIHVRGGAGGIVYVPRLNTVEADVARAAKHDRQNAHIRPASPYCVQPVPLERPAQVDVENY